MVRSGVQAIELNIEHVGKPGQRMPVGRVYGGECPGHSAPRQSIRDDRVGRHVVGVVIIHKVVVPHLGIHHQIGRNQCQ